MLLTSQRLKDHRFSEIFGYKKEVIISFYENIKKVLIMNSGNILGCRIRSLREDNGFTQKELSLMIGLTPKMISFYENNQRTPPIDVLAKIAKIFNVTVDYLIGEPLSNTLPKNLSVKELNLLRFFRGTSQHDVDAETKWGPISKYFPDVLSLTSEERDLLEYYRDLSIKDRRWIMGQMIDLIKKADEHASDVPKAQGS